MMQKGIDPKTMDNIEVEKDEKEEPKIEPRKEKKPPRADAPGKYSVAEGSPRPRARAPSNKYGDYDPKKFSSKNTYLCKLFPV